MPERKLPWVIKYRPKKVADVINQDEAKQLVLKWIKEWQVGKPSRKAALFYGPPGCGKTSLAEAVANEYGLEYLEMNASDYRRASDIERIAKIAATQRGLFAKGKLIVLDEVDGMSRVADRGAMEAILDLIKVTRNPIIMTANDPWNPSLRPLRENVLLVPFKRLSKTDVRKVLVRICKLEELACEEDAINYIAEKAEGDLRSAINDLQAVAEGYGRVTLSVVKAVLRARDRVFDPFEVVRRIFISKYAWQAKLAASQTDLSPDELIQWINENLPRQVSDPEDLWRAYEALSKADIYMGRIIKTGSWDLLAYAVELMTAGVSLAIRNDIKSKYRWVKYSFPQKILMMAKTKEVRQIREDLATIIARHLHISKRLAKSDVIPYLVAIFESNPEYAASLAIGLNLSDSMIKYLSPRNSSRIIELAKKIREQIAKEAREVTKKEVAREKMPKPEAVPEAKKARKRRRKEKGAGLEAFFKK
ncbi:MAG: replication factor C large subunit [Desulfurococcales archaeon]|nr:replication factor C large subunit [Desulfurococcales archaeon]